MTSTKTASVFGHNPKFAYNFYLTEIAKYERGEPAAVQRKDNVLYVQLPTNGKLLPDPSSWKLSSGRCSSMRRLGIGYRCGLSPTRAIATRKPCQIRRSSSTAISTR